MKRICLLASVGLACSAGEPLTSTPSMDASVPMDATVLEKPSFVVTYPMDGQLFDSARVEVRGTAVHLDAIQIDGADVPVIDGAFVHAVELDGEGTHEIIVSAPNAGEQRIEVRIDLFPPVLEILSPPRGAFLESSEGSTIRVEGRVTDSGSAIERLLLNGTTVLLSGDRFSLELPAKHGVNLIDAVAYDEAGHSADVLQGAIWGEYAPWDQLLPDAVTLGLRADVFDVFEAGLEQGLATGLSTAAIAQQNPELTVDAIAFSNIQVDIVPRTGFLDTSVVVEGLAIDFTLNTVILGTPVNTTGVMAADSVEITTEIHIGLDANGQLQAHTEDSTAAISNFTLTAQNVAPWVTGVLAAILEPQLEMGFLQAIDAQDLSAIFDLSQFLPEQFSAQITGVSLEPTGMTILADAAILLPADPEAPPAPGVLLSRGVALEEIPTTNMLRTNLSDDLLNGALFHTWRSGALTASIAPEQVPGEIALDAATFALFVGDDLFDYADPTTPVTLKLRPLLPPVATLSEEAIHLDAADVLIDFTLEGEEPIRFATFAVVLETTTRLTVNNGAVETETQSAVRIDLAEAPLFPLEEELLEDLITSIVLAGQLANPIQAGTIPLPTDGLTNLSIQLSSDYLSILGDL